MLGPALVGDSGFCGESTPRANAPGGDILGTFDDWLLFTRSLDMLLFPMMLLFGEVNGLKLSGWLAPIGGRCGEVACDILGRKL